MGGGLETSADSKKRDCIRIISFSVGFGGVPKSNIGRQVLLALKKGVKSFRSKSSVRWFIQSGLVHRGKVRSSV